MAQPRGQLFGLLSVSYPDTRLVYLVILEQRRRDYLRVQGFQPLRRRLFIGPPGSGKTMTASALAGDLYLPLFLIQLDWLITKFMGETAAKLRLVFDALNETTGVYLFDEVDALGGERARSNDVGEIRRILNSLLQFLERDQSDSLLVAATNHPQLLDRAMFRRFNAVIEYPLPTGDVVRALIRNRLATVRLGRIAWQSLFAAADGLRRAEITLAAERAAKDVILTKAEVVTTAALVSELRERQGEFVR